MARIRFEAASIATAAAYSTRVICSIITLLPYDEGPLEASQTAVTIRHLPPRSTSPASGWSVLPWSPTFGWSRLSPASQDRCLPPFIADDLDP